MKLQAINKLTEQEAKIILLSCCCSNAWVNRMLKVRPYKSTEDLYWQADNNWKNLQESDYLEAFEGHPKIGDVNSLRKKYANTLALASSEQSGIDTATESDLQALADGNLLYEKKFGFIFIVCATGKSANEMLQLLQQRLLNDRASELINACEQQRKITRIRLEKLL